MADSFLDHLPSRERERIRKRMQSPEAYAALRERVKGPEDLEREMERSEKLAELHFALETESSVHEKLKKHVQEAIRSGGVEGALEGSLSAEARHAVEGGKFLLRVSSHPKTHDDALVVVPEGKVQEKLPVKTTLADQWMNTL